MKRYDHDALCDLLEVADRSRVIFEQGVGREAIVRVYPSNPLMNMREMRPDDLAMDARGRIRLGTYYDGSPLWFRLFDPKTGNAQRGAVFGTTGAGKSRLVQAILIACKQSGIVVHLADLKSGQSVPEAAGNVATRVTTQYETILMLRGLVAEAERRMNDYAARGRSGFVINDPDPLMYGIVDEANRLLEKNAPFRDEAAYLIKELGRTGRSVGVGIIIAAQAGHLDELGGSDTLRAMLKEGEVILLRWSSGMMQQLVGDGLVPRGEALQPIPKVIGRVQRIRRYNEVATDDDEDANSQGMLYHLTGPRPMSMARTFVVGSVAPTTGFDPLILDLYGPGAPPGEVIDLMAYVTAKELKALADSDDGEGAAGPAGGSTAPVAAAAAAAEPEPSTAPKSIADRVLALLPPEGMTVPDLMVALDADGHSTRPVRRGTLNTTLSTMRKEGLLPRPDGSGLVLPNPS
ncbi:transfer protein [Streptomyces sp. LP11]|uniref:Transfer protein n=1 Tax=Streptomyces pyxinicus TaxID=2970331 RepID=A0ABT2BD51_9ACTN|nr:DNA/RNA helicase domain-containing protein [Streptomyces sp. LP11]MCS0605985.1 transfer protein [Streptomyces sp. LP11]